MKIKISSKSFNYEDDIWFDSNINEYVYKDHSFKSLDKAYKHRYLAKASEINEPNVLGEYISLLESVKDYCEELNKKDNIKFNIK